MKRHLLPLIVAAIFLGLPASHLRSAAQNTRVPLAFTHVTVLDTEHSLTHDDQTVLVVADRISDVSPKR